MKFLGVLTLFVVLTVSWAKPLTNVKYVGLKQLGKYSGVNEEGTAYEKTFFAAMFLTMSPPDARSFCKSFGPNVDLVSFESRNEFLAVRSKFETEIRDQSTFVIVGGFAHQNSAGKIDYHWISSGLKTFTALEVPRDKMCLGVGKERAEPATFAPISCNESFRFMCQEIDIQYAN